MTFPSVLSAQGLPDTSICRGEFLSLEARGDYEIYRWTPREQLVWSVNEKAILSPGTSQVYTVRARRRLGVEYVVDGSFDRDGRGSTSGLTRSSGRSFSPGTSAIVANSGALSKDASNCPELSGSPEARFLAVYGIANQTVDAWCQRVPVEGGKIYNFRATTSTLLAETVGRIGFTVDGKLIDRLVAPYPYPCTWRAYGVDYLAPATTEVEICVQVTSPKEHGSREALDEISFREYDVDYLDTFKVTVRDAPIAREETRLVCDASRFREYGLDLAPGERGSARIPMPNGCDSVINIRVQGVKTLYSFDTVRSLCIGDRVAVAGKTLDVSGDTTLLQLTRSTSGCDSVASVRLETFDANDVSLSVERAACNARTTTVIVVPEPKTATVSWADGSTSGYERSDIPTGRSTRLTVSDGAGCSVELAVNVPVARGPALTLDSLRQPSCPDASDGRAYFAVSIARDERAEFRLRSSSDERSLGSSNAGPVQTGGLGAGWYTIEAVDASGCRDSLDFEMISPESPTIVLRGDSFILRGLTAQFELEGAGAYPAERFGWTYTGSTTEVLDPADGRRLSLKPLSGGLLRSELRLDNGCIVGAERYLRREDPRRPLFPGAFSPNGDGINDRFAVIDHPGVAEVLSLQIYDRWGGLIFNTSGSDGVWTGADLDTGTYIYTAEMRFLDGSTQVVNGSVDLLR